uniref:Uncharacterized protein n=1 Tax=Anguilla anguilla TaxID=7936 RepID=A0A0E9W3N1_ANGAN
MALVNKQLSRQILASIYVVPTPVPGDQSFCSSSCQLQQNAPHSTAGDLVELLISRIRCAQSGLEMKIDRMGEVQK